MNGFKFIILAAFLVMYALHSQAELTDELLKARALVEAGAVESAVSAYQSVISDNGKLYEARLELGKLFFYREQYAQAIRQFMACRDLDCDNREALFFLGKVYIFSGEKGQGYKILSGISDFEPAQEILKQSGRDFSASKEKEEKKPAKKPMVKSIKPETEAEMWEKAQKHLDAGRYERAFFYLVKLCQKMDDKELPWKKILFLTGKHGYQLGEYTDASSALEKLIKISEENEGFKLLSTIYSREGEFSKAAFILEKALEIEPSDVENMGNLAIFYKKLDMPLKAIDNLVQLLKIEPDNVLANYNLALIYYENGQFVEAMNLVRKIEKLIPPKNRIYRYTQILERKLEKCLKTR